MPVALWERGHMGRRSHGVGCDFARITYGGNDLSSGFVRERFLTAAEDF